MSCEQVKRSNIQKASESDRVGRILGMRRRAQCP